MPILDPYYFFQFLFLVVIPSLVIPFFFFARTKESKENFNAVIMFSALLIMFSFFANSIWEKFVFNKVYYEWDRMLLPFSFFGHEAPLLDGTATWLAAGWTLTGLRLLWLVMMLGICFLSAKITLLLPVPRDEYQQLKGIMKNSVFVLTTISVISFAFWTVFQP